MDPIQQLPSSGLIAQATTNLDLLDEFRGWAPLSGGQAEIRFKAKDADGQRLYEVKGAKSTVIVRAASFAEAETQVTKLISNKSLAPRARSASKKPLQPTPSSPWSSTRTTKGVNDIKVPAEPSVGGAVSELTTPRPAAAPPSAKASAIIAQNAPAPAGALEVKLKQQMEAMAKEGGARNVKELVTVPELNPLYNAKTAAVWKRMNQSAYASSGGRYGVSKSGESGSQGSVVKLYGAENLVARSEKTNLAGTAVYSLLGACAGWNLNGIAGMNMAQRRAQVPAGIARDMANLGLRNLKTGVGNVWLETFIQASGGAVVTVISNEGIRAAGKVLGRGQSSWAPKAPMYAGMVAASFSVNFSLTALDEMEKVGWLGGKLPSNPTAMQRLTDVLKKGAAIGFGVFVVIAPVARKQPGNTPFKTALLFGLPMIQFVFGNKAVGNLKTEQAAPGAAGDLNSNGGNAKINKYNAGDALRNGANPFESADLNRTPAGKYQNLGTPSLKLAVAVLELQDSTRESAATPNVRYNPEAAAVIERAIVQDKAGTLAAPAKKLLRALLGNLKENDFYFGSADVKSAAKAAPPSDAGAPSATPAQRKFLREVFSGQTRREYKEKTDIGNASVNLVLTAFTFLRPKLGGPIAAVLDDYVNPSGVTYDDIGRTYPGFSERVIAKYGDVFTALGVKAPLNGKLTAPQRQAAELLVMKSMYSAVYQVIESRPGSAKQHGRSNIPPQRGANGGYFFTAFERMTPGEKTKLRSMVQKDLEEKTNYIGNRKSNKPVQIKPIPELSLPPSSYPTTPSFGKGLRLGS